MRSDLPDQCRRSDGLYGDCPSFAALHFAYFAELSPTANVGTSILKGSFYIWHGNFYGKAGFYENWLFAEPAL